MNVKTKLIKIIKKTLRALQGLKRSLGISPIEKTGSILKAKNSPSFACLKSHKKRKIRYPGSPNFLGKPHPRILDVKPWDTLPSRTGVLSGAKVFGPTLAVCDKNWILVKELSRDWGKKTDDLRVVRQIFLPKKVRVHGPVVLAAILGGETYFHWMTEGLPLLCETLRVLKAKNIKPAAIITHQELKGFHRETLNLVGVGQAKVFQINRREYFDCDSLYFTVPKIVSGRLSSEEIKLLRKKILRKKPSNKTFRHLAILRRRNESRGLVHYEQIRNILHRKGFEIIDPSKMTVKDQARLFSEAKVVIGAHGAALTNLVFCRPDTSVLEIFSALYINPCYGHLSLLCRLRYFALVGPDQRGGRPRISNEAAAPITLPADDFAKHLDRFFCETGLALNLK
jgi:hypothetical protein